MANHRDPTHGLPLSGDGPLAHAEIAVRLPAQDLDRARRFYADTLGLEPVEERDGGLRYRCGGSCFSLFASTGRASGEHTQMGWMVKDIEATVADLRAKGIEFLEYDFPGFRTVDGIVDIDGTYASDGGKGERAAWFHDSEGNLLAVGQLM